MDTAQLDSIRHHIMGIAREAGELIKHYYHNPVDVQLKDAVTLDVVTEADKKAEEIISKALMAAYPDHHLVGEEGGGMGAPFESAEYRWYIDPIDGTMNFTRRIPLFSTSIAMADKDGNPLVGVVYDAMRDEMFSAARGVGAFLNDEPMALSDVTTLGEAVLASGFPFDRRLQPYNNIDIWSAFVIEARDVRRLGSAALELAYLACGRIDGYWERGLNLWDVMGGLACLMEVGGKVTDYQGNEMPQNLPNREYVATNGAFHEDVLRVIQANLPKTD